MKKNTLSAIFMTLFLLISCNNSGTESEALGNEESTSGKKTQSKNVDLKAMSDKIKEVSLFISDVKEIEVLIGSIDNLVKAIGKKTGSNDALQAEADHNGALIAGAFTVMSSVKSKLQALENKAEKFDGIKEKILSVKKENEAFLAKIKTKSADLGKEGVTDSHAKEAIDRIGNSSGDKGASDLVKVNSAMGILVADVQKILDSLLKELAALSSKVTETGSK
ncbi:hypothetical protein F0310_04820 (plasmid) [Borrelia sp. A-FGy1]|uniref:Vsp/OspC family lipoprotein n=1 Tax=Borrelia sp. A-FGy1 TaxID=2608247 RepID=UPI0015F671B3|nr:Vsp/OspC family lipoprotein [Borrelia sp. A-FGy1]QMU99739.1 hypothetical protein F0310_04820 [Borrelia sp. A-FGy1]